MTKSYSKGISLKVLHSLTFTIISLLMIDYSATFHILQVVFIQAVAGAFASYVLLKIINKPIAIKIGWHSLAYYFARAIISLVSFITWVRVMKQIGVNEAMAIGYLTPVWLIISSIIFFFEKITITNLVVIASNTIGIILILRPKFDNIATLDLLLALFTTVLWAIYDSICKKQTATEHYFLQAFYSFTFFAIIALPFVADIWKPISVIELTVISLIGLIQLVNLLALFGAYLYAPINILIPFSYTRLLFAVLFSYYFYNILPTFESLLGALIILSVNIYYYVYNIKESKLAK